ncbi:uncharacterized protein LOC106881241 [Octopus bimaculoides]|uniref:CABIT domain-containing protein n=1 Tax=Octopus bimaculoides TaxID=37653 RepID=A0A0L8FTJ7_OCTBM|nr:uncharacterized protein LOC106881241 [Octopus bimaculoides]
MTEELNWSERSYTLTDIDSKLKINSCLVKIEEGQELESFLDLFAIKCFKNLFRVQAYRMNNNEDLTDTSTYGEGVSIPINYTKHGSIIPLYGASHVFKTVEEMIMAFPRFVEVQDNLTFCSNNCLIHLKPGDHLELLKVEKTTNSSGKQLVCQKTDNKERLNLSASSIGHFKTVPDPNTYSIKDVLRILKLPQVINFESNSDVADLEGAESNASDTEFSGSYLLVGLQKSRAVVINCLSEENDNDASYLLPLDSDLFEHLKYHFAFRNDFKSIKICKSKSGNETLDQESLEMVKKYTQNSIESGAKDIYQMTAFENNYNYYSTYYTRGKQLHHALTAPCTYCSCIYFAVSFTHHTHTHLHTTHKHSSPLMHKNTAALSTCALKLYLCLSTAFSSGGHV